MSTVASRITRRYAWYALVVLLDRPSRALPRRRARALADTPRPRQRSLIRA